MKFKPGQEVTPKIKAEQWMQIMGDVAMPIPAFGKVYTVEGYPAIAFPDMMSLVEIPGQYLYWEQNFEALVPQERVEQDLEEIIEMI